MQLRTPEDQQACFEELFSFTNGYNINNNARTKYQQHNPNGIKTMYGETVFETIQQIFSHSLIKDAINTAKVFYDLGSGIGNVVIASAILGYFDEIHGVELMEGSYENAVFLRNTLGQLFPEVAKKIHFHNESFIEHDFSNADVVFANHPISFDCKDILLQLEENFQKLKKGAIVLYVIRNLENTHNFEKIFAQRFKFSWGDSTVYAYKKTV